jgi:hypothetical protein
MSGQSQDPANTDYGLSTSTSTGGIGHELGTSELDTGEHGTNKLGTSTGMRLGTGTGELGTDELGTDELGTDGLGTDELCPNVTGTH